MTHTIEHNIAIARGIASHPTQILNLSSVIHDLIKVRRALSQAVTGASIAENVMILGDDVSLKIAINNLIDNSLFYGTRACISLEVKAKVALIIIDDEGQGIPLSQRESVFEPFVRLETSRSLSTGGAGLGLTITHQIVLKHHGSIQLEDAPDHGLRVIVSIPFHKA
jgi:signal transduction histidine kinase